MSYLIKNIIYNIDNLLFDQNKLSSTERKWQYRTLVLVVNAIQELLHIILNHILNVFFSLYKFSLHRGLKSMFEGSKLKEIQAVDAKYYKFGIHWKKW